MILFFITISIQKMIQIVENLVDFRIKAHWLFLLFSRLNLNSYCQKLISSKTKLNDLFFQYQSCSHQSQTFNI